jgi:exodeoxyribonuclease III
MIPKSSYPSDQKILRVVSINVNGLRSAEKKGIFDWIATSDADVICMQESRITHEQWTDKFKPEGWHTHLFPAERPGYAGTAIYSRLPFVSVTDGLGFELADSQGRFIFNQIDTLCSKVQLYFKTDHNHERKKEPFQVPFLSI